MKKRSLFLIIVLFTILVTGCKYNFIVPEEVTPPNPGDEPVSYETQIQPVFDAKCIDCHKPGASNGLDLTSANSYNQVVPKHVNLSKPEESRIYLMPLRANSTKHKQAKYSDNEAILVLTWIEEGAKE